MSYNLKTATIAIRKAAAMYGIRTGKYELVFDPAATGPEEKIATVTNGRKTVTLTVGDITYADFLTWRKVNSLVAKNKFGRGERSIFWRPKINLVDDGAN